jgi:glutamine synthetase
MYKPQKSASARIEHRGLDSGCNPYLAFAIVLAAGMKGVEEKYDLPPEAEDNVWSLSENERRAMGLAPLPRNLDEAIRTMEDSDLVAETLGEHVFEFFLRNKRAEWQGYRSQVTQFEIDRLMPVL